MIPPGADPARAARVSMDDLASNRDVFERFFDHAGIGLALADLSGRYVRVNASYAALVGRLIEDLVGVPIAEVLRDTDGEPVNLASLLVGATSSMDLELRYLRHDGTEVWVQHRISTVAGPDGAAVWYAVSAQDMTDRHAAEQALRERHDRLSEQAVRDPLTGLANRFLLAERLGAALARDARSGESTAVVFLDLDGFKGVNDRFGHAVGDAVLREVAVRLRSAVRPSDTVARLGGDEFVVVMERASDRALARLSERLAEQVTAPMRVQGQTLDVGVSVGVSLASAGRSDADGLLAQADARMYGAKRRVGDRSVRPIWPGDGRDTPQQC